MVYYYISGNFELGRTLENLRDSVGLYSALSSSRTSLALCLPSFPGVLVPPDPVLLL